MPGFDSLRNDPQASRLLGDSAKLEQLKDAPETQKLFDMLRQGTGGELEQAAGKAAKGDTGQLMGGEVFPSESYRYAMALIAAGPVLVIFPFFQKYFSKGMTLGGVKG